MSKIALPIAELKPALTGLGKIIAKRTTLPVLSHLKIERTKDGWIALTGTDLDHFVTVRLEQPSQGEPLSLLVPYDELLKISKNCPKTDSLLLDGDSKAVTIQYAIGSQVAEAKVDSLSVEEFPETPRIKGEPIPVSDAVRQSIHDAMECASTDPTRAILNGAYLDVTKPNAHYVVGTDGRHLFSSNSFSLPMKESILIPSHRFLGFKEFNNDGEWQLKFGTGKEMPQPLQLSSRRWRFICRQIEGNYPNWRQVVPDGSGTQTTITVDREAVEAILQTVTRMPDHDAVNHGLGMEVTGQQVRVLGKSSQDDTWTRVTLEGVKIQGKEVTTFLNREFLAKALRFGLTRIEIIDALSPLKFSEGGRQMIVMPVRADPSPTPVPAKSPEPIPPTTAQHEPSAQNPPPPAEQPKENPMPNTNGNTSPATPATNVVEKTALETALAQIEIVRGDFRNGIAGLNKLADSLKQAQREQKAGEKEVQSVRQTLRSLQSVRI